MCAHLSIVSNPDDEYVKASGVNILRSENLSNCRYVSSRPAFPDCTDSRMQHKRKLRVHSGASAHFDIEVPSEERLCLLFLAHPTAHEQCMNTVTPDAHAESNRELKHSP